MAIQPHRSHYLCNLHSKLGSICVKEAGYLLSCPAHIVGWVKREVGTIYFGLAYLSAIQQSELSTKIAYPTRLVADRRLNPTYEYRLGH